jgi:hypothetical protein
MGEIRVMLGIEKKDIGRFSLLAAGLIFSLLSTRSPGLSSYAYLSLEDYILQSKIILIGKAVEKSADPVKIDEKSFIELGIEQTRYYSLKIEVSKVLKGEVIGSHVRLLYPVFKFRSSGKGYIAWITEPLYFYTELEEWGKERIWFLAESKVEVGSYEKVNIYSLCSYSLVECTLGILKLSESKQVPEIIKMLASDKKSFVLTALDMLPRRKANAAAKPLVSMLAVEDEEIRGNVYWALVKINDEAGNLKLIQVIEYNLKNKIDLDIMSEVIENFYDRRVIPVLIEALVYPEFNIKVAAISKLGDFRASEALEKLLPCLGHSEAYVRNETYEALGKIGDPKALPHLEKALKLASRQERENIMQAIREIRKRESPLTSVQSE